MATGSPEMYTYFHMLSLHDALPIFAHGTAVRFRTRRPIAGRDRRHSHRRPTRGPTPCAGSTVRDLLAHVVGLTEAFRQAATKERSEEHTSELQSLMRISYAVFCLHKKILTQHSQILLLHTTH